MCIPFMRGKDFWDGILLDQLHGWLKVGQLLNASYPSSGDHLVIKYNQISPKEILNLSYNSWTITGTLLKHGR